MACVIAAAHCTAAYGRARGHRPVWCGVRRRRRPRRGRLGRGAGVHAAGLPATSAFYFGFLASVCLIVGATLLGLRALSRARFDHMADALIFSTLIAAMSVYFVVAARA